MTPSHTPSEALQRRASERRRVRCSGKLGSAFAPDILVRAGDVQECQLGAPNVYCKGDSCAGDEALCGTSGLAPPTATKQDQRSWRTKRAEPRSSVASARALRGMTSGTDAEDDARISQQSSVTDLC